jgi:hypothetical protein
MVFNTGAYWSAVQKTSWSEFHKIFNAVQHEYESKLPWSSFLNLPWGWHHIESIGKDPSAMDIHYKASMVSSAIAEKNFIEPDFEVRDRTSEVQDDNYNFKQFPDVCIQAFREKFQRCIPLVFEGDFRLTNENGSETKRLTVSYGGRSSLSTSPHGVHTLEDEDSREELHNCTMAELQIALNTPVTQDASGDDSDSGLPQEFQTTGIAHVKEFGEVHKSPIPIQVIQKLPFIMVQEQDLHYDLHKEQWSLIRKASELGSLQDMKEVKEKFIQRFHWQNPAVKGLFRFMDDLQHYQTFNKDTSDEKADSDVSSEHFMDAVGPFTASGLHGETALVQEQK